MKAPADNAYSIDVRDRASQICTEWGYCLDSIITGGRRQDIVAVRVDLVKILHQEGGKTADIADLFRMKPVTIGDYLRGKVTGKWNQNTN